MIKKRYSTEQIIAKLRAAEVELAKGQRAAEVCRRIGISEQTYYRWRREYGGLRVDQAKKLGDTDRARHWYERFTEDWKDADPDIPELIEARERLGELEAEKVAAQ